MPKAGQPIDEFCNRVSDLGFPVSEDAMKLCQKLDKEYEKRDQDLLRMHIYNDCGMALGCLRLWRTL